MNETVVGIIAIAAPALLIGGILFGRHRPVFWMFVAALFVGIGYLTTTGAVDDVGDEVIGYIGSPPPPVPAPQPAVAPAAAPAPASEPQPAAEPAPASEAAPAPSAEPSAAEPPATEPAPATAP